MKTNFKFKIWKLIDKVFITTAILLLSPLKLFRKKIDLDRNKIKKIIAIEFLGFGDVILTLPALKKIKERYPFAKIDVLTFSGYEDVLSKQDYVHEVHQNSPGFLLKNMQKYDLAIDFGQFTKYSGLASFILGKSNIGYTHSIRSIIYDKKIDFKDGIHMSESFYNLIGEIVEAKYEPQLIKISYKNTSNSKNILRKIDGGKLIGMHIGSSTAQSKRCWPRENFAKLANLILKKDKQTKIILFGTKSERDDCEKLIEYLPLELRKRIFNIAGDTSLNEVVALISNLDFFIGNDSGPMHIGAAQGIPTLGIFAANLPIRYKPLNEKSDFIFKCACKNSPCINIQKGSGEPSKECECDKCYKSITPEEVYSQFQAKNL